MRKVNSRCHFSEALGLEFDLIETCFRLEVCPG